MLKRDRWLWCKFWRQSVTFVHTCHSEFTGIIIVPLFANAEKWKRHYLSVYVFYLICYVWQWVSFFLLIYSLVFIAMGILQNIIPYRKGYFANDQSIQYPYHSSTVPSSLLYAVTSVLIVVAVISSVFRWINKFQIVAVELIIARDYLSTKRSGIPLVRLLSNVVVFEHSGFIRHL